MSGYPSAWCLRPRLGPIGSRAALPLVAALVLVGMITPARSASAAGPRSCIVQRQLVCVSIQFTSGPFATAEWATQTSACGFPCPGTFTDTTVAVNRNTRLGGGSELTVQQSVTTFDANGNLISSSDTYTDVFTGFTFTVDGIHLTGAAVHATGLPANFCNLDTCGATTIDVSVTWSGQGPITRGAVNSRSVLTGRNNLRLQIEHLSGATRAASATGSVGAESYSAADALVPPPALGNIQTGFFFICQNVGCEN
jgi:hypothetical protein